RRVGPYSNGINHSYFRVLKLGTAKGYHRVMLHINGLRQRVLVHHLVATTFIGPRLPGMQINHKNGIKTDNRPQNLEWVTSKDNNIHALVTGLRRGPFGEKAPNSKLTQSEIVEIRRLGPTTLQRELAERFGVTSSHISNIL